MKKQHRRATEVFCAVIALLSFASRANEVKKEIPHDTDAPQPAITFEQAVEEGVRANRDLLAAKYNISSAEADELTAGLWSNPMLQVDALQQTFGGNWNQTNAGGPRQYDVIVQYPFDLSGKRSAAKKSARFTTKIVEAAFQDAVRQKVLQIKLGYIDVLTFSHQLSLSKEKENDLTRLVQMVQNKIGGQGRLPLLQRRAQLARAQAALDTQAKEITLKNAKTNLALLLGRPAIDASVQTATKLRDFKMPELPPVESLIKEALVQRPDLNALRLALSKSDSDSELAHAQVWDNINWSFGLTRQGPNSANPNDPNSQQQPSALSWQTTLQIPLPVFNRSQGNIQKAAVSRAQAEKQIAALELLIHQEIDSSFDQLKLNRHLIAEYEEKQLEAARVVRNSQQTQFGTGNAALLDYFDAIGAYYTTLSSYYDAVGECRRNVSRLQSSVGKDVAL